MGIRQFNQNLLIFMSGGPGSSQPIHQICILHLFISVIYIIIYYGAQTHKNVAIKISCKLESCSRTILAKESHHERLSWQFSPKQLGTSLVEVFVLLLLEVEQLEDGKKGAH